MSTRIYGIDLGTTYSCIARVDDDGRAEMIDSAEGGNTVPSVAYFQADGSVAVGEAAVAEGPRDPEHVIELIKRHMGESDYFEEQYGRRYTPAEVSSFILRKLASDAEMQTGEKVTDVVITCPAYFGLAAREATRQAGQIAGFTVHYVIPEPTAAAIHYSAQQDTDQTILVYDLGGGTFDVTVMRVEGDRVDVVATDGNARLGGKDWDEKLANYLADEFSSKTGVPADDLLNDLAAWRELSILAEKMKRGLTAKNTVKDTVRFGTDHALVELTRERFDELTRELLDSTVSLTEAAISQAKDLGADRIDKILLVGGSTLMPQVKARIEAMGIAPVAHNKPNLAVGLGAALMGHSCRLKGMVEEEMERLFKTKGEARTANPEEVRRKAEAAVGAKMGLPAGKPLRVLDVGLVSSKNFGIEVLVERDGEDVLECCNLILRNERIPATESRTFVTHVNNQSSVRLRLWENEVDTEKFDSVPLSDCSLVDDGADLEFPRPVPKGTKVQVDFNLSQDGELSATGTAEGRRTDVKVQIEGLLSPEQVEKARKFQDAMRVS